MTAGFATGSTAWNCSLTPPTTFAGRRPICGRATRRGGRDGGRSLGRRWTPVSPCASRPAWPAVASRRVVRSTPGSSRASGQYCAGDRRWPSVPAYAVPRLPRTPTTRPESMAVGHASLSSSAERRRRRRGASQCRLAPASGGSRRRLVSAPDDSCRLRSRRDLGGGRRHRTEARASRRGDRGRGLAAVPGLARPARRHSEATNDRSPRLARDAERDRDHHCRRCLQVVVDDVERLGQGYPCAHRRTARLGGHPPASHLAASVGNPLGARSGRSGGACRGDGHSGRMAPRSGGLRRRLRRGVGRGPGRSLPGAAV